MFAFGVKSFPSFPSTFWAELGIFFPYLTLSGGFVIITLFPILIL